MPISPYHNTCRLIEVYEVMTTPFDFLETLHSLSSKTQTPIELFAITFSRACNELSTEDRDHPPINTICELFDNISKSPEFTKLNPQTQSDLTEKQVTLKKTLDTHPLLHMFSSVQSTPIPENKDDINSLIFTLYREPLLNPYRFLEERTGLWPIKKQVFFIQEVLKNKSAQQFFPQYEQTLQYFATQVFVQESLHLQKEICDLFAQILPYTPSSCTQLFTAHLLPLEVAYYKNSLAKDIKAAALSLAAEPTIPILENRTSRWSLTKKILFVQHILTDPLFKLATEANFLDILNYFSSQISLLPIEIQNAISHILGPLPSICTAHRLQQQIKDGVGFPKQIKENSDETTVPYQQWLFFIFHLMQELPDFHTYHYLLHFFLNNIVPEIPQNEREALPYLFFPNKFTTPVSLKEAFTLHLLPLELSYIKQSPPHTPMHYFFRSLKEEEKYEQEVDMSTWTLAQYIFCFQHITNRRSQIHTDPIVRYMKILEQFQNTIFSQQPPLIQKSIQEIFENSLLLHNNDARALLRLRPV